MKNERMSVSGVGAGSLLTVLAVLCLVVFTVLSISTVQSQKALSERSAAAVEAYYRADTRAEEILARLRGGEIPEEVRCEGDICRYDIPVSDTQRLEVEILVSGNQYTVLRWQAVSAIVWEEAPGGQVWSGG